MEQFGTEWTAPSAAEIEQAVVELETTVISNMLDAQAKELHTATGDWATIEYISGFNLGLQAARVHLAGSVTLAEKGIKPTELL